MHNCADRNRPELLIMKASIAEDKGQSCTDGARQWRVLLESSLSLAASVWST